MFNRGADPSHPYDTAFQDYFHLEYIEGLKSPADSIEELANNSGETRSLVAHMDRVEELPEGHPVRRMADIIPEPDHSGLSFGDMGESERVEDELKDVVRGAVEENGGDWYDTWDSIEEDVKTVKSNIFEYNDVRKEHDRELEIQVEGSGGIHNAYTNPFFDTEVYHGEKFDAEIKDGKAFIQFHDSEFYTSPEKILSEDEFREVRNGSQRYNELDSDQKALFDIYSQSTLEREFNF